MRLLLHTFLIQARVRVHCEWVSKLSYTPRRPCNLLWSFFDSSGIQKYQHTISLTGCKWYQWRAKWFNCFFLKFIRFFWSCITAAINFNFFHMDVFLFISFFSPEQLCLFFYVLHSCRKTAFTESTPKTGCTFCFEQTSSYRFSSVNTTTLYIQNLRRISMCIQPWYEISSLIFPLTAHSSHMIT